MTDKIDNVLLEFIQYNNWANQRLLRACEELDEAHLDLDCPGAYGTIRDILAHIIRGESWYLQLLTDTRPQPPFAWDAPPTLAQMRDYAAEVGAALAQAAQRIPVDAHIQEPDDGVVHHFRAMPLYIQLINHGIEHRTNITTVLNQQGLKPPGLDGWAYLNAAWDRFGLE